jgi:multicomponent Na+:H+ antiporter subunit D
MVVSAAGESHRAAIFLLLTLASAGTFLHTGLKLPYYMFFGKDSGIRAHEPPSNMLVAMGLTAAACIIIGVFPALLYGQLPFPVDYVPYTVRHVTSTLGLLGFTALGFFLLLKHLDPERTVSLDTDWFYRRGASAVVKISRDGLVPTEDVVGQIYDVVMRRFVLGAAGRLRELDARVIDSAAVGIGSVTAMMSRDLSTSVSGHAQHYGLLMAAGVLAAIAIAVFGW